MLLTVTGLCTGVVPAWHGCVMQRRCFGVGMGAAYQCAVVEGAGVGVSRRGCCRVRASWSGWWPRVAREGEGWVGGCGSGAVQCGVAERLVGGGRLGWRMWGGGYARV
eukprot:5792258-Amphidinium_carterae.1